MSKDRLSFTAMEMATMARSHADCISDGRMVGLEMKALSSNVRNIKLGLARRIIRKIGFLWTA